MGLVRFALIIVLTCATARPSVAQETAVEDQMAPLIEGLYDGSLTCDGVYALIAVALQQPGLFDFLDVSRAEVIERVWQRTECVTTPPPSAAYLQSMDAYRTGDFALGDSPFTEATEAAPSDSVRATLYHRLWTTPYGSLSDLDRALSLVPSHGHATYRRVGMVADAVGRPNPPRGRFAYWCLADIYHNVADSTSGQVRDAALRGAAAYERAAPRHDEIADMGLELGDTVTADLGSFGMYTTTVR